MITELVSLSKSTMKLLLVTRMVNRSSASVRESSTVRIENVSKHPALSIAPIVRVKFTD